MVKHIVFWKLKEGAAGRSAKDNAVEMKSRLEALRSVVPGIVALEVGLDFSRTDESADVALYSEFVDRAALEAYQNHPEHLAVGGFIRDVRSLRIVVDYEV